MCIEIYIDILVHFVMDTKSYNNSSRSNTNRNKNSSDGGSSSSSGNLVQRRQPFRRNSDAMTAILRIRCVLDALLRLEKAEHLFVRL
jgi:hypothetical protein